VRHAWRALTGLLAIVVVLFGVNALGVYAFGKSSWTPELALDLQGGTQIILEAKTPDGAAPTTEQMNQAAAIIRQRVDASGVGETDITTQAGNQIVVQIPGQADDETRNRIAASAQMQLRAVLYTTAASTSYVGEDGNQTPYPTPDPSRRHPDGVADQRQRPQLGDPGSPGGVPRIRLLEQGERPGERAQGSAGDRVRPGRHREVHPRSGRTRRLVDHGCHGRHEHAERPVGRQRRLRRGGREDLRRGQPASLRVHEGGQTRRTSSPSSSTAPSSPHRR
jgi:hypothetical protein